MNEQSTNCYREEVLQLGLKFMHKSPKSDKQNEGLVWQKSFVTEQQLKTKTSEVF